MKNLVIQIIFKYFQKKLNYIFLRKEAMKKSKMELNKARKLHECVK